MSLVTLLLPRNNMDNIIFRIDDIGASTKHFNQHGRKWVKLFGKKILYFPLADLSFFKRLPPFRGWAKYDELTAEEWEGMLAIFEENNVIPVIAVTACWVEADSTLVPFNQKFPAAADILKKAFGSGKIIIANHGLTHCVVGKHLPLFWGSNRRYHREFLPELDEEIHREHILKSQEILEKFFQKRIEILVPPGNTWSYKTYLALKGTNINKIMCNRYMADSSAPMEGVTFKDDAAGVIAFHDRELKLYGKKWLVSKLDSNKKMTEALITICTVNYNSSDFIKLMLYALEKLTYNPYRVIICDNNSKESDYDKLRAIISRAGYDNVELYRSTTPLLGSMAHGTALNDLSKKIDTKYGAIMDADAMFLIKDWDKILIDQMSNEVPIYGTQSAALGSKPTDFPLMFAVCFIADIFGKLSVDFRPRDLKKLEDTGYQLREKYLANNFRGGLLYDFSTRTFKKGPFRNVACNEYYFESDGSGHIFASHFGRGSSPRAKSLLRVGSQFRALSKTINFVLWYPNIVKWKIDKYRWLKICKRIIDGQCYGK